MSVLFRKDRHPHPPHHAGNDPVGDNEIRITQDLIEFLIQRGCHRVNLLRGKMIRYPVKRI